MTILLLTKQKSGYERKRLEESFADRNMNVLVSHPNKFDIVLTNQVSQSVKHEGKDFPWPELVLTRGGAGENNFNLALLREFEQALVPVVNTANSIEMARDKIRSGQLLANNGLSVPKTMMFRFPVDYDLVEKEIGFPCVVKVVTGSQGNGVYLCDSRKEFKKLMGIAIGMGNKKTLLVQEYLGERIGEDLRVLVIGGKVIGAMRRISNNDFRANISQGGRGEPFPVTEEIDFLSRESSRLLGLDITGVDLLFNNGKFSICEVNSNPGFRGFETYCNVNVADAITEYVKFKTQ